MELEQTIIERALVDAATIAGLAPSIHNTQPWRWRIHGTVGSLFAEPARQLRISDFDRRLLVTSCGAALHHAGIALAARGYAAQVDRMPDPANEEHLARITVTGNVAVTTAAMRLLETVKVRRTDRRPLLDVPLPAGVIDALREAAASFQIGLVYARPRSNHRVGRCDGTGATRRDRRRQCVRGTICVVGRAPARRRRYTRREHSRSAYADDSADPRLRSRRNVARVRGGRQRSHLCHPVRPRRCAGRLDPRR